MPFYKKQVINKSTRVILDLFNLLYYNTKIENAYDGVVISLPCTQNFYAAQGIILCKS